MPTPWLRPRQGRPVPKPHSRAGGGSSGGRGAGEGPRGCEGRGGCGQGDKGMRVAGPRSPRRQRAVGAQAGLRAGGPMTKGRKAERPEQVQQTAGWTSQHMCPMRKETRGPRGLDVGPDPGFESGSTADGRRDHGAMSLLLRSPLASSVKEAEPTPACHALCVGGQPHRTQGEARHTLKAQGAEGRLCRDGRWPGDPGAEGRRGTPS